MSLKDTATLILNEMASMIKAKTNELLLEINSKPIYTINELLHGKKVVPKSIHMIGGPAHVLKDMIESAYFLPCYVPKDYAVANAIGAALAKPTSELTLLANTALGTLSVPEFGIYEHISKNYTVDQAKTKAIELLRKHALSNKMDESLTEIEITEESSFNMVRGFSSSGKNIRIKAQIKPGHILELGGVIHES